MSRPRLDSNAREIALLARAGYPIVYLVTHEEQRALRLVEAAASAGKREFLSWSVASGFDQESPSSANEDARGALDRIADLDQPAMTVLLDFHHYLSDPTTLRRLREIGQSGVKRKQTIVLIAPYLQLPKELEKDVAVFDLPLPNLKTMSQVLVAVAKYERVEIAPDLIDRAARSALGLTEKQAERVFRKVLVVSKGLQDEDLAKIVSEKKSVLRSNDVLEFFDLSASLSDVGGLDELKQWVGSRTAAFDREAQDFGLPPPKGLLLLGVQGCGKSLSAKAVANLWKFPLLRLDFGAVFSASSGGAEGSIREAIKIAESLAPVVLWIDELEKGLGGSSRSEQASHVLGSFISWLSEKTAQVFVVATANDVSALPPELLRRGRFDEIFFVDLPNRQERLEILKVHLRKRGRDADHFSGLAGVVEQCEQFSGAEIEQVVIAGLYQAFSEGRELQIDDLYESAKATVPLSQTFEEQIKLLRDWASTRARSASTDTRMRDMFGAGE